LLNNELSSVGTLSFDEFIDAKLLSILTKG
jgi:hypothetical protein